MLKANVNILFRTPMPHLIVRTAVMVTLYCELVKDVLVEYLYDANVSGLQYGCSDYSAGLSVSI